MATIGTFKKDGAGYSGSIETLTLKAKLTFEPVEKEATKRQRPGLPNLSPYRIADLGNGAAWKKTIQGRRIPLPHHLNDCQ